MITEKERKEIKQVLGSKHIAKISKYFAENNIVNRGENPYAYDVISRVFNANKGAENPTIEAGIFQCVRDYPEILKKEKEKRAEILQEAIKEIAE